MGLSNVLNTLPELEAGKKVVSVLSGGLDSTILTYMLVAKYGFENVVALSYNYGQKHSIELEMAAKTCEKLNINHKILDITFLGDIIAPVSALSATSDLVMPNIEDILGEPQPISYVPYRNLILFSIALSFAESNNAAFIMNGLQAHDLYAYWDTTQEFTDRVNAISELNRKNAIQIVSPFVTFTKKDEIEVGLELNVDWSETWTCYNGDSVNGACGRCPSCSERIMNFAKAGIKDTCNYSIDIDWDKLIFSEKE